MPTIQMHPLPILLSAIKPKAPAPQSDKYSRNLFNWVKRNGPRYGAGIWCTQRSVITGEPMPFDYKSADRGDIYIGFFDNDYISGINVKRILIGERQTGAYIAKNPLEITEWFWNEYLKRGRCIFDADHDESFQYDDGRYQMMGTTRCCNWCGIQQELRVKTYEVKREIWVNK